MNIVKARIAAGRRTATELVAVHTDPETNTTYLIRDGELVYVQTEESEIDFEHGLWAEVQGKYFKFTHEPLYATGVKREDLDALFLEAEKNY